MGTFRYTDILEPIDLESLEEKASSYDFLILSYPDDEGVRNNHGRPGANRGPERILHFLSRLNLHLVKTPKIMTSVLSPRGLSLEKRHERAEKILQKIFQNKNLSVITLGGGHDYGYPDSAAYYECYQGEILNIDAHLDVREMVDGQINSGTPFYRFAERFGGEPLVEWGINFHANSQRLFEYAKKKKIRVFSYEQEIPQLSGSIGLSICLDAFQNIRAVSAPSFSGLQPGSGLQAIRTYAKDAPWLGVYECAPDLDPHSEDSARLAAAFISEYIHYRRGFDASDLF